MGVMDFSNFKEFVAFCESATPESWSNKDIARFNKRVYSLIRSDKEFSKNYQKIKAMVAKRSVRNNLKQKRKVIGLQQKRRQHQMCSMNKKLSTLHNGMCS